MIKNKLREIGIPCISIRGEGYGNGEGNSEDNPESDYWKKISLNKKIKEWFFGCILYCLICPFLPTLRYRQKLM